MKRCLTTRVRQLRPDEIEDVVNIIRKNENHLVFPEPVNLDEVLFIFLYLTGSCFLFVKKCGSTKVVLLFF